MGIESGRFIEHQNQPKTGVLLVLAGPTASGKTSVLEKLREINPSLKRVVSSTTRSKRSNEQDGVDYHFLSPEAFTLLEEQEVFVETTRYGSNRYGTRKSDLTPIFQGEDVAWVVTMKQTIELPSYFSERFSADEADMLTRSLLPILIGTTSLQTLRQRFVSERGGSRELFRQRIREDWQIWNEYGDSFYQIRNEEGELDQTVQTVVDLMENRRHMLTPNP